MTRTLWALLTFHESPLQFIATKFIDKMTAFAGEKMRLISIVIVAAAALILTPYPIAGECYDGAPSAKVTTPRKWIAGAIAKHDEYRLAHGACPLKFNKKLTEIAQAHANELAKEDSFARSKLSRTDCLGENLAEKSQTTEFKLDSTNVVYEWYQDQVADYSFKLGAAKKPGAKISRLTQLLWKESREIGIAYTKYNGHGLIKYVVVAEYFPKGNSVPENKDNVLAKGTPLPDECAHAKPRSAKDVEEEMKNGSSRLLASRSFRMLTFWIIAAISHAFTL